MKTGNTSASTSRPYSARTASMEPGHEDREYVPPDHPGMHTAYSLNGARS